MNLNPLAALKAFFGPTVKNQKNLKITKNNKKLNLNNASKNVEVLHIVDYSSFDEVTNLILSINFDEFPKLFAFVVEGNFASFNNNLRLKCKRVLVIQIISNNDTLLFYKRKYDNIFHNVKEIWNWNPLNNISLLDETIANILVNWVFVLDWNDIILKIFNFHNLKFDDAKILNFIKENNMKALKVGFDKNVSMKFKEKYLIECITSNNFNAFTFILSQTSVSFELIKSCFDLSFDKKLYDFCHELLELKMNNEDFISSLDLLSKLNYFYRILFELLLTIEEGNLIGVKVYVEHFPTLKVCKKTSVTAIEKAIDCRQFEIFAYLVSKNFFTKGWNKRCELSQLEREKIRDEMLKIIPKESLMDTIVTFLFDECYEEAFINLRYEKSSIEFYLKFMKVLGFKILIDPVRGSTFLMNPVFEPHHSVIDYSVKVIYISKCDSTKEYLYEITKRVLEVICQKIYGNLNEPYQKHDKKAQSEWNEFMRKTRERKGCEVLHDKNLIAYAAYLHSFPFLSDNSQKYSELLEFFESKILVDIKNACEEALNEDFKTLYNNLPNLPDNKQKFIDVNAKSQNFLHYIVKYNKNIEMVLKVFRKVLTLDEQREIFKAHDNNQKNIFHYCYEDDERLELVFDYATKILSRYEIEKLFYRSGNIFEKAIKNSNGKNFEALWKIFFQIIGFESEKVRELLNYAAVNNNEIFAHLYDMASKSKNFRKVLLEGENILAKIDDASKIKFGDLTRANCLNVKRHNPSLFATILFTGNSDILSTSSIFKSDDEFKETFKKEVRNIFALAFRNDDIDELKILIDQFDKVFTRNERKQILIKENNFLNDAILLCESSNVLSQFVDYLEKNFSKKDIKKLLQTKNEKGQNAFILSMCKFETFFIILELYLKHFEFSEFFFEKDENGKNVVVHLAQFDSETLNYVLENVKIVLKPEDFEKLEKEIKKRKSLPQLHALRMLISNPSNEPIDHVPAMSHMKFEDEEFGRPDHNQMIISFSPFDRENYFSQNIHYKPTSERFPFNFDEIPENFVAQGPNEIMEYHGGEEAPYYNPFESAFNENLQDKNYSSCDSSNLVDYEEMSLNFSQCSRGSSVDFDFDEGFISKVLNKCRKSSDNYDENSKEIIEIIQNVSENYDIKLCLNVVASYGPIIFDFDCDEKFVKSSRYLKCLPENGPDLIYVLINGESKIEKFSFEVAKAALKIIFGDEETLQKLTDQKTIFDEIALQMVQCKIKKDLQNFLRPILEFPNGNEIRELNRKFLLTKRLRKPKICLNNQIQFIDMSKNLTCITSNLPQALLHLIFSKMVEKNFTTEFENLFVDLKLINLSKIKDIFHEIACLDSVKRIFIDATTCNEKLLDAFFSQSISAKILFFGYANSNLTQLLHKFGIVNELNFTFKWSNLTESSQQILKETKINYQNREVEFGEIFTSNFDEIPPEILQTLSSNKQLVINSTKFIDDIPRLPLNFQIKQEVLLNSESPETIQNLFYSSNVSIDELLKKVEGSKIILMVEKANSGKTIAMRKIHEKYFQTSKFIKFISIDEDTEIDEKDIKKFVKSKLFDQNDLIFFEKAFNEGNAIIFIDEIKKLNEIVESWIKSAKNNQIWISAKNDVGNQIERFVATEIKIKLTKIRLAVTTNEELKAFYETYAKTFNQTSNLQRSFNYLLRTYPHYTFASALALSLKWELEDNNLTLSSICEQLLSFAVGSWNSHNKTNIEVRRIFQYYALKCFFNSKRPIFGLFCLKSKLPDKIEDLKIIQFDDEIVYFTNACWIDFFIADYLKEYFEAPSRAYENNQEVYEFFLKVLLNKDLKNLRKMLNEMKIKAENENLPQIGNAMKAELPVETLWHEDEENFNLLSFVIKAIRKAEWDQNISKLNEIVTLIVIALIPKDHSTAFEDFLEQVFDVPLQEFKAIVSTKDKNKRTFYHHLIEKSKDDQALKWMIGRYQKFNLGQCETLNSLLNEKKNEIFEIIIVKGNTELLSFLLNYVNFDKWKDILEIAFNSEDFALYKIVKDFGTEKFSNITTYIDKYEKILDDISQLHRDIEANDLILVQNFVTTHQKLKICNGRELCNASNRALSNKNFEIFSYLISKGFKVTNDQKLEDYKNQIRNANVESSVRTENYHKFLLFTKCFKSESSSGISFEETEKLINDLFKLERVKNVLKAISTTDVKIILVNDEKRLEKFCMEEGSDGMFYPGSNTILISNCDNLRTKHGVFA